VFKLHAVAYETAKNPKAREVARPDDDRGEVAEDGQVGIHGDSDERHRDIEKGETTAATLAVERGAAGFLGEKPPRRCGEREGEAKEACHDDGERED
jgi:hypothetical protein